MGDDRDQMPDERVLAGYGVGQHMRQVIEWPIEQAVYVAAEKIGIVSRPIIMSQDEAQRRPVPVTKQWVLQDDAMIVIDKAAVQGIGKRQNYEKTKQQDMKAGR